MFKWGIRNRLIVSFLFLIVITLSLLGGYILWFFYQYNLDTLTANLLTNAQITEQLLVEQMRGPTEKAGIDSKIKELAAGNNLRVTVVDVDGKVLADSWENPALMENHLDRQEVATALAGNNGTAIRYSTTINQNMLYASIPVHLADEVLGVVRVASTLEYVESSFDRIKSVVLVAMLLTSLLAVLLSIRLARRYTAPLEEITAVARKFAKGNLEERIHIHTGDELEILSHTLNHLASNLDDKINEAIAETNKLSLILRHMDNAVIVMDRYGRVTTANQTACRIFSITPAMIGQHNIHILGNSLFDHSVHETIDQSKNKVIDLKTHIQGTKRVFQVFLAPIMATISDITGVIAVFHDITALQEMHERQAEFVANASHELATPLTAIKGFTETLLDGALHDPALSTKFLNIIHTETERMHRLVKDLLQLAKLNSQEYQQQVKLEPTHIEPLLRMVVQELLPQSSRKNITVSIEMDSQPLLVMANHDWLKQVVVNLLDNSIKYSPSHSTVLLKCWQENSQAVVMVKDSGMGIPAKDLPLIFDRFYRVDRARSRSAGGTGLGLSIVKFIVEMHGGKVSVQSAENIGTTIQFTLPLVDEV